MKKLRKVLALVLAMVMVLAIGITTNAATITINPADTTGTDDTTYTAYKVFDAVKSADGSKIAYSVKSDSPWLTVLQNQKQTWVSVTASANGKTYTITANSTLTAATAEEFANYLNTNKPTRLTGEYAGRPFTKNSNGKYVTGTIDEGYYLITSSLGTKLILDTTQADEIQEKNSYPKDNKEAETASVSVGENATYYITVAVPANVDTTKPITVHDKLPVELNFNNDVKAYVDDTPETEWTLNDKKGFTYSDLPSGIEVKTQDKKHTDCTFEITVPTANLAGKTIVFKYSAELLSTALSDKGYVNREFIDYSNYSSTPKVPEVKTYDFNINKTDSTGAALTGAEFELRKTTNGPAIAFNEISTTDGEGEDAVTTITGYKKADLDDTGTTITLKAGSINVSGLGAGTYYLIETKAPDGFNKLQSAITVVIADNGTISFTVGTGNDGTTVQNDKVNVVNKAGTELPSTGGMGTTLFYVFGAVLVIGAGIVLVARRRMAK